jgi:hypothetical protein
MILPGVSAAEALLNQMLGSNQKRNLPDLP